MNNGDYRLANEVLRSGSIEYFYFIVKNKNLDLNTKFNLDGSNSISLVESLIKLDNKQQIDRFIQLKANFEDKLLYAVENKAWAITKYLLENKKYNLKKDSLAPLYVARQLKSDLLKSLVLNGFKLNIYDANKNNVLTYLISDKSLIMNNYSQSILCANIINSQINLNNKCNVKKYNPISLAIENNNMLGAVILINSAIDSNRNFKLNKNQKDKVLAYCNIDDNKTDQNLKSFMQILNSYIEKNKLKRVVYSSDEDKVIKRKLGL